MEDFKCYKVTVTTSIELLVEAVDEEDACRIANDCVDFDKAAVRDISVEECSSGEEAKSLYRLADQVIYFD